MLSCLITRSLHGAIRMSIASAIMEVPPRTAFCFRIAIEDVERLNDPYAIAVGATVRRVSCVGVVVAADHPVMQASKRARSPTSRETIGYIAMWQTPF